jgi:hypothetical protein
MKIQLQQFPQWETAQVRILRLSAFVTFVMLSFLSWRERVSFVTNTGRLGKVLCFFTMQRTRYFSGLIFSILRDSSW